MLSRIYRRILLLSFVLLPLVSFGQISKPAIPLSSLYNKFTPPASVVIQPAEIERSRHKAEAQTGLKPFLFAYPVDTLIDVLKEGSWDELSDGSRICRLEISSEGAFSLNVLFDKFNVPPGVNVFIYTPDMGTLRGAYTDINNKKSRKLATTPLPGESLVIEVDIPPVRLDFETELLIGRISHDFTDAFGFKSGYGKSGDCNVDINCPEGADWQVEKRSVVKFIRGGYWLCTGALINNTANDGRALLYTANHCIASQGQAESSVFYFNYESPTCDGPNGRLDHSISASDLLATTNKLDFALVELSLDPPLDFEPYYAGWNRVVSASNNNVTCIHHPSGDVKKITRCYGTVVTGNFGSGFDNNTHWHVPSWDLGTTEGGSSGSPLFDKDHKIIGDLTGGDASCDYNYNDYFQKFFVCWDRYPEPENQLKYWLDPLDNGALIWNGYDPTKAGIPLANYSYGPLEPIAGKEIRFKDQSEGQPSTWDWTFENGSPSYSNEQDPVVKFNSSGEFKVKLVVNNTFGSDSLFQTVAVRDFTGFEANQTRVVKGARVEFRDISTGEPISHQWIFEGGDPASSSLPGEVEVRYKEPGIYDVTLVIGYPDFTDTLYYRDYINVVPETLLFSGKGLRTIRKEYASEAFKIEGRGWIAGSNDIGIDAFSNAFLISKDTLNVASGIRISIGLLPDDVAGSYLTAVLWDEDFNEIIRDSVEIRNEPFPDYQTIWFRHPVGVDSLVYAGFIVPEFDDGIFCSKIATPRNLTDSGSAFARLNGNWLGLYEASGLVSDLSITLETEYIFQDFKSQIKLSPVITGDRIYLDLNTLVFDTFHVYVYDLAGREVITDYSLTDKYLDLEFLEPVSGMYLMVFRLDNLTFTKKILLVRNR
jgi:PKD repeat protein